MSQASSESTSGVTAINYGDTVSGANNSPSTLVIVALALALIWWIWRKKI